MSYRDLRPVLEGLPPGPFRSDEAPGLGLSPRSVSRYLAAGVLRRPLRGVLVRADLPDCFELRAEAVRLALPRHAVLCRGAAAWLYGVDPRPPGQQLAPVPVECYVPVGRQPPRRAGVRCYVTDVDPRDVVEVGAATCTSPERTAVDLARRLSPGMGLAVLDAMARDGLVIPAELLDEVERWRGDRWIARARRLVSLADPRAESYGESWLRLRFHDAGFPPPDLQITLADRFGAEIFRLDLGYLERRLSWEYDGRELHDGPAARRHDERRRARIRREWGWTVWGVGLGDVLGRSMHLEHAVGDALGIEPRISRRPW